MTDNERLMALCSKYESYTVDMRRAIHRFAEVAGQEKKTRELIEREAKKLKLISERVSETGVLVTLDSGRPGNNVALRADIDALPIVENECNTRMKRAVISENKGCCHACGHDAHTAMLLTAMKILAEMKDAVSGKVFFCFEEGEEIGSGWLGMIDALKSKDINAVWGIHVSTALESGKISVEPGPRMGGMAGVSVNVIGRGGHGSRPDLSLNPVFCAASILTNLATAFVNQIDANETVTLGITSIQGGSVSNVFPDSASILGSMRFFSRREGQKAVRILKNVARHTAAMNGCEVEFLPLTNVLFDPTINDEQACDFAKNSLKEVLPEGTVVWSDKWFGTESFSEYLKRYKGVFAFLGVRNSEKGCDAEHHNEKFDLDEDAMKVGVTATVKYALDAARSAEVGGWGYTEPEAAPDEDDEPEERQAPAPAAERAAAASNAKYNLDSKIGVLLKSEGAKKAVDNIVKGVVNHPQIGLVKGMTIRKAAKILPDKFTPEVLEKMEQALAKVED